MEIQTIHKNYQTIKDRFKYFDIICIYILFAVSCFLLVSSFVNFRSGHQSQTILTNLQNWQSSQIFKQNDNHLKELLDQIEKKISQLVNLERDDEKLFLRIKKKYLQENEDEDEIEQIQTFQSKLNKMKAIIKRKQPQVKALRQQYEDVFIKLKDQYEGRQRQGLAYFKQHGQEMIKQGEKTQQALTQFLTRHSRWYKETLEDQLKWEDSELNVMGVVQYFGESYELRKQFKLMPQLAQKVLYPSPIQFLSYLYAKQTNLRQFLAQREHFYHGRLQMTKLKTVNPSLNLIRYNILSSLETNEWNREVFQQYKRLQTTYKFRQLNEQKSICVVVPSFNNNQLFRVQLNLNSIFSQNYTNYKVVIMDDASTDGTQDLIEKYLKYYSIPESKGQLIKNVVSKKALQNIYFGILSFCTKQEIVIIVDGDDELIGFNVLKVINAAYTHEKIGFLYSNFYYYQQSKKHVEKGFTAQYTQGEKQQNYRRVNQKFSHLITFKIELLKQVKDRHLKDESGKFYDVAYDFALCYPLMQLACGHVKRLDEYQYLYNIGTGLNDYAIMKQHQQKIGKMILSKIPYSCAPEYLK